ncbi:MAG: nuclear transport factor 2 family protein [bacterium]|nr:nuclear transport factor 2 family protein [bacterium]
MIDKHDIERALDAINAAENALAELGVEGVIAAIDRTMAPSVEGWMNGGHRPDREAERAVERWLFAELPDYHRSIERSVIEPPRAAIGWRIRGTSRSLGRRLEIVGASHFELDDEGRIARYWVYVDQSAFQP